MVYLYSIISGFRAILGSVAIQLAMGVLVFVFVKSPENPYLPDTETTAAFDVKAELNMLEFTMTGTHMFCGFGIMISNYATESGIWLISLSLIFAMVAQVCNIARICEYVFVLS